MKKLLMLAIVAIVLSSPVIALKGSMKLLAVSEVAGGYKGSVADLGLEVKEGAGRVFIDTSPLTKLDTQISTRLAKEIACRQLGFDCSRYDFFYTISAEAAIVGGPSAGAATTLLTMSLLDNLPLNRDVAVTGTINSGGLIGPVSGLKEKVDAARTAGVKMVLIPAGERKVKWNNLSFDLAEYAADYGIKVVEVSDVYEALEQLTGKRFETVQDNISIDAEYSEVMKTLAAKVCNQTTLLQGSVGGPATLVDSAFVEAERKAINFSIKGDAALKNGNYYSAASYCFGANVNYRYMMLRAENLSNRAVEARIKDVRREIDGFNISEYRTLTDLQVNAMIMERLEDSGDFLNKSQDEIRNMEFNAALSDLAYAVERLNSAHSWQEFFGMKGKAFEFSADKLRNACLGKVSEAEERYQYVNLFLSGYLLDTRRKLDSAHLDYDNGNYEVCLVKASVAKAESDSVLALFGVEEDNINVLVEKKLSLIRRILIMDTKGDVFPIVGYSYYEYADSLKGEDPYAALLYSGYALEMSGWDLYFEKNSRAVRLSLTVSDRMQLLLIGAILGFSICFTAFRGSRREKKKKILVRRRH